MERSRLSVSCSAKLRRLADAQNDPCLFNLWLRCPFGADCRKRQQGGADAPRPAAATTNLNLAARFCAFLGGLLTRLPGKALNMSSTLRTPAELSPER